MVTMDQKLADLLNAWTIDGWPIGNFILCLISLILCVVLVGLIGIEREKRGRSAGLRTHLLVGVGSTILMIISIYGFPQIFQEHRDVARLAAQIITGVGFLGAGAIIHGSSGIKGLTTAGTIWASMAIGLACGSYNFFIAILGTFLIVIVLTVFKRVEVKVNKKSPSLILTVEAGKPAVEQISLICHKHDCTMRHLTISKLDNGKPDLLEIVFQVEYEGKEYDINLLMGEIAAELKPETINILSHL